MQKCLIVYGIYDKKKKKSKCLFGNNMALDDCLNKKLLKADTVQKAYDTSQFLMKGSTDTDVHNICILSYIEVLTTKK